ncbi:phosphoribosylanthranilate isomerase [Enterococcus cecorum]|uniref:phosphoribosylanthranilate isomerase n=1 Tax=Enterococcus cecorum TaxID=44008 RepID=UPI0032C4A4A2
MCAKLVNQRIIQVIQLHGAEDEATIRHYQQTLKIPVIKAFGIQPPDDVKKAIQSSADYLLFDYKVAGSGKTFDWRYIQEFKHDYFLAGGINSENLKDALSLNPYAIDLSSAIETNGRKDNQKMTTIINIMRG